MGDECRENPLAWRGDRLESTNAARSLAEVRRQPTAGVGVGVGTAKRLDAESASPSPKMVAGSSSAQNDGFALLSLFMKSMTAWWRRKSSIRNFVPLSSSFGPLNSEQPKPGLSWG